MSLTEKPLLQLAWMLAAVLAIAAFTLACSDDGDTDNTTPTPESTSVGEDTETPTPNEGTGQTTPTETLSGVQAELRSLINGWFDGVNAKVTYDYVSNFGGHPEGVYTTYYLDGADRHDWLNLTNEFGITITTIVNGDEAYVCTTSEVTASCRSETADQAITTRAALLIIVQTLETIVNEMDTLAVSALPDGEIAGLLSHCYEVKTTGSRISAGPPADEIVVTCFSEEGALLRIDHDIVFEDDSLPEGDLRFDAQEVDQATPDDFAPTAPVDGS